MVRTLCKTPAPPNSVEICYSRPCLHELHSAGSLSIGQVAFGKHFDQPLGFTILRDRPLFLGRQFVFSGNRREISEQLGAIFGGIDNGKPLG